jgi:hypothetical protein
MAVAIFLIKIELIDDFELSEIKAAGSLKKVNITLFNYYLSNQYD